VTRTQWEHQPEVRDALRTIMPASSLTASAFAARTPFTPEACTWVVGVLGG
jgi:hypothetical protein